MLFARRQCKNAAGDMPGLDVPPRREIKLNKKENEEEEERKRCRLRDRGGRRNRRRWRD